MSFAIKSLSCAALCVAVGFCPAYASDSSDIARVTKLSAPVVDAVLQNVDAYFAAPDAPLNHLTSGILKDLTLKVIKNRLSNLDDAAPGKGSDSTFEDKNAIYRAAIRTTSHNTSETRDCVENKISLTSSEGLPVVKDGVFGFDTVHPRVTNWGWNVTFCRTATSAGEFSDWQLSTDGR